MQRLFLLLFSLFSLFANAQQQQEELRSSSQLAFPEFREARVLQTFGRSVQVKANILLRNSALCYIDPKDSLIRQAANKSIIGVDFDSLHYRRVTDGQMGLVVAEQNGNMLLRVRTIDMKRYKELTTGGTDMPFFEIDMAGRGLDHFMDLSSAEQAANKGYPLRQEFFFLVRGRVIPANNRMLRGEVKEEFREAYRRQTNDGFWSWRDEASLAKLLMFL